MTAALRMTTATGWKIVAKLAKKRSDSSNFVLTTRIATSLPDARVVRYPDVTQLRAGAEFHLRCCARPQ
jgi:hypothetical protein